MMTTHLSDLIGKWAPVIPERWRQWALFRGERSAVAGAIGSLSAALGGTSLIMAADNWVGVAGVVTGAITALGGVAIQLQRLGIERQRLQNEKDMTLISKLIGTLEKRIDGHDRTAQEKGPPGGGP